MHRFLFAFVGMMSLLSVQAGYAAAGKDPYQHFFNETFGDFTEELATARAQGKKGVLVFFEMDECPFCHWMKQNVLNQPEVQTYFRDNFLSFAVDIEGDVEITDFEGNAMPQKDFAFKVNRVRATPVFAFYDLEGKQIQRFTGRTRDAEEFMLLGRFVAEGHYASDKFTKFKREQRK